MNIKKIIIGIYKITSPSGRIYIGQSNNVYSRWRQYKRLKSCDEQEKLYNSFLKYGVENHTFEVMCECLSERLNEREIYYGELFDVTGRNGLNIRACGGSYGKHNETTKEKLRIANKGKRPSQKTIDAAILANRNREINEDTRKIMSENTQGENNPNYGKTTSEKAKEKQRQKRKLYWDKRREEGNMTITEEHIKNSANARRGLKRTAEQNKANSEARKNKKRSLSSCKKQGDSIRGDKNHMFGKTPSIDTIEKYKETIKNKPQSEKDAAIAKGVATKKRNKEAKLAKKEAERLEKEYQDSFCAEWNEHEAYC